MPYAMKLLDTLVSRGFDEKSETYSIYVPGNIYLYSSFRELKHKKLKYFLGASNI